MRPTRSALALAVIVAIWVAHLPLTTITYSAKFTYRATYTYTNRGNETITLDRDHVRFSLLMNNSWATVILSSSDPPVESTDRDEDGNLYAEISADRELSPGEKLIISLEYHVDSRSREIPAINEEASQDLEAIDPSLVQEFTGSLGPWRYDEWPSIQELAYQIKGNETNVLRIVDRFVSWIHDCVDYPESVHEVPLYPNETLLLGVGDCDDQTNLLVTMCRAVGIPAYVQIGVILYEGLKPENYSIWDGHVTIQSEHVGWHGWAMVYIPPWGWLPIDMTWGAGGEAYDFITNSAVSHVYTIPSDNVTSMDYIADTLEERGDLVGSDLYVTISETMALPEEMEREDVEATQPWITSYPMASPIGIFALAAVTVISVIVIVRYRSSRAGMKGN
ncbi:MAG: transglutaminase family protein [Candidatus Bathyarchaeia archaeon]